MDLNDNNYGKPVLLTATGTVKDVGGRIVGFYVNSTTSGTLVLRDGGASGEALSGTITPAVGWHEWRGSFATDLHATIGGTALNVTFFVN
jgi:hypothetical protein